MIISQWWKYRKMGCITLGPWTDSHIYNVLNNTLYQTLFKSFNPVISSFHFREFTPIILSHRNLKIYVQETFTIIMSACDNNKFGNLQKLVNHVLIYPSKEIVGSHWQ
jgi:hypothetical protein